jgi:hypothetical protein
MALSISITFKNKIIVSVYVNFMIFGREWETVAGLVSDAESDENPRTPASGSGFDAMDQETPAKPLERDRE